jgi:predicted helicase
MKLAETGYLFGGVVPEIKVFLTNALEPGEEKGQQMLPGAEDPVADEARAANRVKLGARFTVLVGNPPYSLVSGNMARAHRDLVERYKFVDGARIIERGALQLEKILNDDYVKFLAFAQDSIDASSTGVFSMITNHAYLDNPTMRGVRHQLLLECTGGFYYELGGSAKKATKSIDENVFDIQQGVAICLTYKRGVRQLPSNLYARLCGTQEEKWDALAKTSIGTTCWTELVPSGPDFILAPMDYRLVSEYQEFSSLTDVFPLHSIGCFTSKDHFVIARDRDRLAVNAKAFRDSSLTDDDLCKSLAIVPKDAWNVGRSRQQIRQLSDEDIAGNIVEFVHRPFDKKFIFFHRSLVWSLAQPVNRHLSRPGNMAIVASRQLAAPPWNHVFCSDSVVEMFLMSNRTKEGNHVFPLYLHNDETLHSSNSNFNARTVNFTTDFLNKVAGKISTAIGHDGLPIGLSPEDVFYYIYATLHSPTYRGRYLDLLKGNFPRVPLASAVNLWRRMAILGARLSALHRLIDISLPVAPVEFIGSPSQPIEAARWANGTVWIDKKETTGFLSVPKETWDFQVGCYQVCEKWLKDRKGRTLTPDDITHYQKIIAAITETIRIMTEIDEVIDAHGGWPNAFLTTPTQAP